MFSFFKKNKDQTALPNWAYFFDQKEYEAFLDAIRHYFSSRNVDYEIENGVLNTSNSAFGYEKMGLSNVAQVCKQNQRKHYKEIVADHFDTMIRSLEFENKFQKMVDNYDEIEYYIGVRVYPEEYVSQVGSNNLITRPIAGNLIALLVFDLPDAIQNIKPEEAEKWGKSFDYLFDLGIRNIREKYPIEISEQTYDDFKFWFIDSSHFFTSNIIFDFENHSELVGSNGSLVGLPHRHTAIIYPIENLEVIRAVNLLIPTIYGMNEEGPGSVSNNLFWYHEGILKNLPYELNDESVEFMPTKEFTTMLNHLAELTAN